jgi:hypothetical protein
MLSMTVLGAAQILRGDTNLALTWISILPAALDPGVYSASKQKSVPETEKMCLGSRALPVRKADLTAIYEPIV